MSSDLKTRSSSRGSVSDTASLPCPSPTSSNATSVSCTLCGTKESLLWLPQIDPTSSHPQPQSSDQFVLCAACTADQLPTSHNTRQSSSRKQRSSSASSATNAREKDRLIPTSSDAAKPMPTSSDATKPMPTSSDAAKPMPTSSDAAKPMPTSSDAAKPTSEQAPTAEPPSAPETIPFRRPRKSKPSRAYMQPSTSVCDRAYHDGIRFESGDIVSLIDRDNQGIYFAMIRGLISDIEANKFAFLTWLLPLEPVHVKSINKPAFLPSKYCMGPQDYVPRSIACLRFECSSPLSPSYRYPKSKLDSPFL